MLNKKAQLEDNLEYGIAFLIIIVGVIALTLLQADYEWSTDKAKMSLRGETSIGSFDTSFMGTDLLNILKLPLEEQSLGEVLATVQETPSNAFIQDAGIWSCGPELYTSMHAFLVPIYGENWYITLEDEEQNIVFACTGIATISYQFLAGETNTSMFIPSQNPEEEFRVELGVLV